MSDTEIRMMRYTIEQLSEELRATKQYMSDTESKLERTKKQLEIAVDALETITATPLNSRVIHDSATRALEQIIALEQKDKR